jgi:hypothetical protein
MLYFLVQVQVGASRIDWSQGPAASLLAMATPVISQLLRFYPRQESKRQCSEDD